MDGPSLMNASFLNFHHEAMNTTFSIRLSKRFDMLPVSSITMECFQRLDGLEQLLSRYAEGSDIQQINAMHSGQSLFISKECYDCLVLSNQMHQDTHGLFDITLGKLIEHYKKELVSTKPLLEGRWLLDDARTRIECVEAGREMDLGGIGKGYALDQLEQVLKGWDIDEGLIAAGASTQLVFGEYEVKFELQGDLKNEYIFVKNKSLSASGVGIQAVHIISPLSQNVQTQFKRVWCVADSASLADAWSTAAMLMTTSQLMEALAKFNYLDTFITEDFEGSFNRLK
jgi:FAD:protein FMN transferase